MTTKARLHEIVESLSDADLAGAERALTDPWVLALLTTPEGAPPLSAEEIAGLVEAKRDVETGRVQEFESLTDLLADLHGEGDQATQPCGLYEPSDFAGPIGG